MRNGLWRAGILVCVLVANASSHAAEFVIDAARPAGIVRALHGGNDGPLQFGGLVDLTAAHRELGIPHTRLHDCRWPNPDVVDMHVVFPDPKADPADPGSYSFGRTDECIDAVVKTGAKVIYRLGESIEHAPRKLYVHPPADYERWAAACIGVIRHYNEGWAAGRRHGIQYWEIWNEPENRPAMWSGSDEDYFRLYETTAKAIKSRWPDLKVGGPSLGYTGKVVDGRFEPGEFLLKFLDYCKSRSLPLDFFSWHLYGNDPSEYLIRARGIREVLERYGYGKAEMHLNEWNYLPDNKWLSFKPETQGAPREEYFSRVTGAEGAAFVAAVLMTLQDSPVAVANFFAANTQALGLFNEHGTPRKTFYAFKAFRGLLDAPKRVQVEGGNGRTLVACAGMNEAKTEVRVLVSNADAATGEITVHLRGLPWEGDSICEVRIVNAEHDLKAAASHRVDATGKLMLPLKGPAVALLIIRAAK